MKKLTLSFLVGLTLASTAAFAAGPLIISDETGTLKPVVWDMSNGQIPVWVDGGGAFTYDVDGVTPFVTIDRAHEMTADAFKQWSQVPTSTFAAAIKGSIESKTGDADVTMANIANYIGVENGPGFWVIYDTDGSIMENFFGVDPSSVLGISSPEFGDGAGHITESWSVFNGWAVNVNDNGGDGSDDPDVVFRNGFEPDTHGAQFAGVITHEIGHAINLSHSQVNGPLVLQSYRSAPLYPGVPGCVDPLFSYTDYPPPDTQHAADPAGIETMFPFIDPAGIAGKEQASVNVTDDIAAISNLYPTADYFATTGTISGILRLKDGTTQYSGINIVARNVDNAQLDAVSDMSGSATQGQMGPDGHFTIHGLTPGAKYVLYIESITAGGYPTTQQMLISEGEYWNTNESSNPVTDGQCSITTITAQAGITSDADITFNGYEDGVQFTPLVAAYMTSLSTDGTRAGGTTAGLDRALLWDKNDGLQVLPVWLTSYQGSIDATGQHMAVQVDPDGNGIREAAIWDPTGHLNYLGDLNGDTCGGSSQSGADSSVGFDIDATGSHVVGMAYNDNDGDGACEGPGDITPFIWDQASGLQTLSFDPTQYWTRANAVSGDGDVVIGTSNFETAWAWVRGDNGFGAAINLTALTGGGDAEAVNADGTVVALDRIDTATYRDLGTTLWNAKAANNTDPSAFTDIDSLRYCVDVPLLDFFLQDMCTGDGALTPQEAYDQAGVLPVSVFGVNDAGTVVIGRGGSFFTKLYGAIWVKDIGWMLMPDFLKKQGVVEATNFTIDNPGAISGDGSVIIGGMAGAAFSWLIDLHQVYVCKGGVSVPTTFPDGLRHEIRDNGAEFGRCEFIN